jgi:hypothetical protein
VQALQEAPPTCHDPEVDALDLATLVVLFFVFLGAVTLAVLLLLLMAD